MRHREVNNTQQGGSFGQRCVCCVLGEMRRWLFTRFSRSRVKGDGGSGRYVKCRRVAVASLSSCGTHITLTRCPSAFSLFFFFCGGYVLLSSRLSCLASCQVFRVCSCSCVPGRMRAAFPCRSVPCYSGRQTKKQSLPFRFFALRWRSTSVLQHTFFTCCFLARNLIPYSKMVSE